MPSKIRIGLVGTGLIARRAHLPALCADPDTEVVALASGRADSARSAAAEFKVPQVYETWEELVADPTVDAVDVCTINSLHAPIAIAAAQAGKHVLVEKPMAVSLEQADAMVAAAESAGTVLMVAHNLRFIPLFAELQRIVAEGTLGRVLSARASFMHAGPDEAWGASSDWFWREEAAGGGALLDLGIHMIDLLRWTVGREVTEVSALTARLEKPTFAEDNAFLLMRFEGDVIAGLQTSWTARPFPDTQMVIQGEKGRAVLGQSSKEPLVVYLAGAGGVNKVVPDLPEKSAFINPYVHFIRVIQGGERPLVDGREGRASLAVAIAAYESARLGQVIRLA
ncbi:MAG: Gfo/Idh/MocA family oxidoreductase [Dehalococcoidia bacterium]